MNPATTDFNAIVQSIEMGLDLEVVTKMQESLQKRFPNTYVGSAYTEFHLKRFITQDPEMIILKKRVRQLANPAIEDPVLILGETGTGKELLAKALHGNRGGQYVSVNCTGLPDELIESELFGHVKGSFTGAATDRVGLLEFANKGTILLDEIGDMPIAMQAKLLRALQPDAEGRRFIRRLGENVHREITCRIVCSTNKDVYQLVKDKVFREDLLWRIGTIRLQISPLRNRKDDIPLIAKSLDEHWISWIQEDTMRKVWLQEKQWTGNVRELQSAIRHWQIFGE